jgi:protein-L-isoaspartate(D-aspartate) O-methyltransferase
MLKIKNNNLNTLTDSYRHRGLRRLLVKKLLEKGIQDIAVLKAIENIPRHYFLDNAFLEKAYQDIAFPIGEGQTISQPYTVAFQTELLEIKKGDKVLEIGTGSGYQAWVLMEMGCELTTIERNEVLYHRTLELLQKIGLRADYVLGDGTLGYSANAPYDKIIVTAGAPVIPPKLIEQLKTNGILVIPVGDEKEQKMLKITKLGADTMKEEVFHNFRFVPLVGEDGWKK